MQISGWIKLSLQDYPGKLACVLFTPGCQFRCPFCHNAELATADARHGELDVQEVFRFLEKRKGLLEAVVISGGEPTLQRELETFLRELRTLPYKIKLDTNGYQPDVLRTLIQQNLVDYVAMDIKNIPENYAETCGLSKIDINHIRESIQILRESDVPHEFRTTLVRELHPKEQIKDYLDWQLGDSPLILQTFRDGPTVMTNGLHAYHEEEMKSFVALLKENIPGTSLRGE